MLKFSVLLQPKGLECNVVVISLQQKGLDRNAKCNFVTAAGLKGCV